MTPLPYDRVARRVFFLSCCSISWRVETLFLLCRCCTNFKRVFSRNLITYRIRYASHENWWTNFCPTCRRKLFCTGPTYCFSIIFSSFFYLFQQNCLLSSQLFRLFHIVAATVIGSNKEQPIKRLFCIKIFGYFFHTIRKCCL